MYDMPMSWSYKTPEESEPNNPASSHASGHVKGYIHGGGPFWRRRLGTADWAPPIVRQTTGRRAVWAPDIWTPFPNFFYFSSYE